MCHCTHGTGPFLQEGMKHLQNENYNAALNTFNAIAKSDPKNGTIYYYIGEVSYLTDDPAEAEKAYKKGTFYQSAMCRMQGRSWQIEA